MPFTAVTKIRFGDVDYAQILYYPRFFYLFHLALEDFFDEHLGAPYAHALKHDNVGFPAVHAAADYFSPLRFGDTVGIELTIDRIGNKSVDFGYAVRKQGTEPLVCRGRVTVVAVRMDSMSGIPIPDKYRRLFERYQQEADDASPTSAPSSMGLTD